MVCSRIEPLVRAFSLTASYARLGEEMRQNLPLELDFQHEAENAARATADFSKHRYTTLYIPKVYHSTKRVMTMEFIEGARVDDLEYLQHRTYPCYTLLLAIRNSCLMWA